MRHVQFERDAQSSDETSGAGAGPEPKPGGHTPDAGSGESARSGDEQAIDGGEDGGAGVGVGAWDADAGLMDAMGLGDDSEPTAQGDKKKTKEETKNEQGGGSVQHSGGGGGAAGVHAAAAHGVSGSGGTLPHLDAIQQSFGKHDVSGVSAHTDGAAASANRTMGSEAYATGDNVAFGSSSPSLHTAAHEAAHVVQQRGGVQLKGGVGEAGDAYEQHADAVADRVVQGKSAEGLLDEMAPAGGGGGGAVQAKMVQFDIKSDLRSAMDGWGTDESAIFRRCERATTAEAQAVLADSALMRELRSELDRGDMTRVLDGLRAPVADKLRLAMAGWGTDEAYIHRTLLQATPADLQAIANNDALVRQLEGELSGNDLKAVLDRLNVGLARKLQFAIRGWGTDEAYLFRAVESATLADVSAAAANASLMAAVDSDLSGEELNRFRGTMARRLWVEGSNGLAAFRLCMGGRGPRASRLRWVSGDITVQRALLDAVLVDGNPADVVLQAFQSYWEVETTVVNGATAWNAAVIVRIHRQMKALPSQDTRAGVWRELQLTGAANLINRAAWNGSALIVGANIGPTGGGGLMGSGSPLTATASVGDTTLAVQEGARFKKDDVVAIDRAAPAKKETAKVTAVAGNTLTIETALTKQHDPPDATHVEQGLVTPDDATALHEVQYLDATVRHEIGHAVETAMGGVTGFTVGIGGWWTGSDIDTWANQMTNPWTPNDGTTISAADLAKIKAVISDAVAGEKGSLITIASGLAADHPLRVNLPKRVPAIDAAEACLSIGENFWQTPGVIYASNGKRFSISGWYKTFMYHHESVVADRLSDYQLFAPAEFFADAYTVFYEEANKLGTPGFTDADLGRMVRNGAQRDWIRNNVHNRGHAPAGTGGGASPSAPPAGEAKPVGTAHAGGAGYGRSSGNPGP